jgi:hypothetical protein
MRDQYTGDLGDFGKYGLLNWICKDSNLELGINWYLTDDDNTSHGEYIEYLCEHKNYKNCDAELYEKLQTILLPGSERIVDNLNEFEQCPHTACKNQKNLISCLRKRAFIKKNGISKKMGRSGNSNPAKMRHCFF